MIAQTLRSALAHGAAIVAIMITLGGLIIYILDKRRR